MDEHQGGDISQSVDLNVDEQGRSHYEDEEKELIKKGKCEGLLVKGIVCSVLIVLIIIIAIFFAQVKAGLGNLVIWISDHPAGGPFVLATVYAIGTVLFVPCVAPVLCVGGGCAFTHGYGSTLLGLFIGVSSCYAGALIGSVSAFLLGKYVFREAVAKCSTKYRIFKALDSVMEGPDGLKITFLMRLTPMIPYIALNYLLAITKITPKVYVLATLGLLPSQFVFVLCGTAISNIQDATSGDAQGGIGLVITMSVLTILGCGGIGYVTITVRKYLKTALEEDEVSSFRTCSVEEFKSTRGSLDAKSRKSTDSNKNEENTPLILSGSKASSSCLNSSDANDVLKV